MISRLIADGFVVPHVDAALDRANLIVGHVGVGKSTIPNAIRFAALGHVPEAGASDEATSKFVRSGRARAEVSVVLADGRTFGRGFDPDGKLRVPNDASWLDPLLTTATDRSAQISALFGRTPDEAAENLYLQGLLEKKGADLKASIDLLLDRGDVPTEVRVARGLELWKAKLDKSRRLDDLGLPKPHHPAVETAVVAAEPEIRARLAEGLLGAIAFAAKKESDAAAASKNANAARITLERRLKELKAPAEAAKILGERRAKAMEERTRLDEDVRVFLNAEGERAAAQRDLDTAVNAEPGAIDRLERARAAAAAIDGLKEGLDAIKDPEDPPNWFQCPINVTARDEEIAPLRAALDAIVDGPAPALGAEVAPDPAALERADALKAEAEELTQQANDLPRTEVPDLTEVERRAVAAKRALGSALEQPWREVEAISDELDVEYQPETDASAALNRLLALDPGSTVVVVDALRGHVVHLRALAKRHGGDVDALKRVANETDEAFRAASEARDAAKAKRDTEDAEEARLRTAAGEKIAESIRVRKDAEDASKEANRIERVRYAEARRVHDEAVAANNERRAEIRRDIAAVEKRYADAAAAVDTERRTAFEAARDEARRAREDNQSRRGAVQARIDELSSELRVSERIRQDAQNAVATARARLEGLRAAQHVDVPTAKARVAELDAALATLDAQIAAAKNADGLRDEIRRERDRCEALSAEATVWGCAEWACRQVQNEDMARRAGPLQEAMNRFLRAAGRPESAFMEFSPRRTDFYWSGPSGSKVYIETLSGGQKVIFRAALAYALLMLRAPEERVLTVELAETGDGATNAALLAGLDAVRDDVQVIACSCVPVAAPAGWNVLRVEAQEEVVDAAA